MSNDTTPSEYVKLISADGFEFVIHREAAMRSGTIKNMLVGPGWGQCNTHAQPLQLLTLLRDSPIQGIGGKRDPFS